MLPFLLQEKNQWSQRKINSGHFNALLPFNLLTKLFTGLTYCYYQKQL